MIGKIRRAFERIGFDPQDDASLRLQKRILLALAAMIAPAAVVWGAAYLALAEPLAASIIIMYPIRGAG